MELINKENITKALNKTIQSEKIAKNLKSKGPAMFRTTYKINEIKDMFYKEPPENLFATTENDKLTKDDLFIKNCIIKHWAHIIDSLDIDTSLANLNNNFKDGHINLINYVNGLSMEIESYLKKNIDAIREYITDDLTKNSEDHFEFDFFCGVKTMQSEMFGQVLGYRLRQAISNKLPDGMSFTDFITDKFYKNYKNIRYFDQKYNTLDVIEDILKRINEKKDKFTEKELKEYEEIKALLYIITNHKITTKIETLLYRGTLKELEVGVHDLCPINLMINMPSKQNTPKLVNKLLVKYCRDLRSNLENLHHTLDNQKINQQIDTNLKYFKIYQEKDETDALKKIKSHVKGIVVILNTKLNQVIEQYPEPQADISIAQNPDVEEIVEEHTNPNINPSHRKKRLVYVLLGVAILLALGVAVSYWTLPSSSTPITN
ncbi:hypothetical protein NEOKW01_0142 [Nematocida sp. AWRm80]|nr:hypothetical protein NEOKW01_0142 [Nematocida sp. AWRm80]